MADKGIFGLHKFTLLCPWKFVVITACWQAIITYAHNPVPVVNNTGAHLCIGVLAAAG